MQTITAALAAAQSADGCGKRRRDDRDTASLRGAGVVLVFIYCLSAALNVGFDVCREERMYLYHIRSTKQRVSAKTTSGVAPGSSGSVPAIYQV